MVKIMENPIKMDDLWGFNPLFSETHNCTNPNVVPLPMSDHLLRRVGSKFVNHVNGLIVLV